MVWLFIFCATGVSLGLAFEFLDLQSKDGKPVAEETFFLCFVGYWAQTIVGGLYTLYLWHRHRRQQQQQQQQQQQEEKEGLGLGLGAGAGAGVGGRSGGSGSGSVELAAAARCSGPSPTAVEGREEISGGVATTARADDSSFGGSLLSRWLISSSSLLGLRLLALSSR